jgi:beta-phosphoglucomutase-like phosphatase (HAD superfamily)
MAGGNQMLWDMRGQTLTAKRFWWDRTPAVEAGVESLGAVIFDIDAMADIERDGQRAAFNAAFAAHAMDISWSVEDYAGLRQIHGDQRRIAADLRRRGFGEDADDIASDLRHTKDALFADCVLDGDVAAHSGLIDSVMSLFVAGVWVGVVSTGQRAWVQPLVRQLVGDGLVETIVTADDVTGCDPHCDVFELALWELGVSPEAALAMVGSASAMHAAARVGIASVAVPTTYTEADDLTAAVAVLDCYDGADPLLAPDCQRLHSRWWTARNRVAAA